MLRMMGPRTGSRNWVLQSLRGKTPEGALGGTTGCGRARSFGCESEKSGGPSGAATCEPHPRSYRPRRMRLTYGGSRINRVTFSYYVNGSFQTESLAFQSSAGISTAAQRQADAQWRGHCHSRARRPGTIRKVWVAPEMGG